MSHAEQNSIRSCHESIQLRRGRAQELFGAAKERFHDTMEQLVKEQRDLQARCTHPNAIGMRGHSRILIKGHCPDCGLKCN